MSIFYDAAHPNGNISFDYIPDQAYTLVLQLDTLLTMIATASTLFQMPSGYSDALTYNLAIRLAPEYGKQAPQEVVAIAIETKANVKRANFVPPVMRCDAGCMQEGGSGFISIYSGGR
jgi:hypothetical protein